MDVNPLVPTKIKIQDVKMNQQQFDRVYGPEHENHIEFHFGGNLFDLGGFENRKIGY